ncbi:MAG: hypothetical protein LBQ06_07020 [Frankiaceae bacterium]|jgi:hypothetical protein|nr:hypothetical protein [Frankiaceae bacterium]
MPDQVSRPLPQWPHKRNLAIVGGWVTVVLVLVGPTSAARLDVKLADWHGNAGPNSTLAVRGLAPMGAVRAKAAAGMQPEMGQPASTPHQDEKSDALAALPRVPGADAIRRPYGAAESIQLSRDQSGEHRL